MRSTARQGIGTSGQCLRSSTCISPALCEAKFGRRKGVWGLPLRETYVDNRTPSVGTTEDSIRSRGCGLTNIAMEPVPYIAKTLNPSVLRFACCKYLRCTGKAAAVSATYRFLVHSTHPDGLGSFQSVHQQGQPLLGGEGGRHGEGGRQGGV